MKLANYWDEYFPSWSIGSLPSRSATQTRQVLRIVYEDCADSLQPRKSEDKTFCHRMVAAACRALGCPIRWIRLSGSTWTELNANDIGRWLASDEGKAAGWKRLADAKQAIQQANAGFPVIVSWINGNGHGHMAMALDTDPASNVPNIMQAGGDVFFDLPAGRGFGVFLAEARYYSHD